MRTSTDAISLRKKFTHNCLSRLRSINEYLVFDWVWTRPLAWQNNTQYIRVRVHLRSSPMATSRSVPFFVLATYQGIRQCGLKLCVPRIVRLCYLRTFLKGISICLFCVCVCMCVCVSVCLCVVVCLCVCVFVCVHMRVCAVLYTCCISFYCFVVLNSVFRNNC